MTELERKERNMAGGIVETDKEKLAASCENFMRGAKKLYDEQGERADMWLFELFHHLEDCAAALRAN